MHLAHHHRMTRNDYLAILRGRVRNWVENAKFATVRELSSAAWNRNVDRGYGLTDAQVARVVTEEVRRWARTLH